jgi:excisionase family DNA binding protein
MEEISIRPIAVSIGRAAELTSLSKTSLRRFARNGRLRTVRLGRRVIVPYNALTELLQNDLGDETSSPKTRSKNSSTGGSQVHPAEYFMEKR